MTPVPARQRILELDVLRGFALWGVLVVNMSYDLGPARTALDHTVAWVVHHLASEAFYPIFSFLFGAGFALQLNRAAARGARFGRLYTRRLLVLLGFGLAHMAFLWWGDILFLYAMLGFVLLLLRGASARTLLVCALVLWTFSGVGRVAHVNSGQAAERLDANLKKAYSSGSYADVVRARLEWMPGHFEQTLTDELVPNVLAFFLLGALAVRRLLPVEEHIDAIRRASAVAIAVAVAAGLALLRWHRTFLEIVFKTALAALYAGALVLLLERPAWKRRLRPLGSAGRMALTNYLAQSAAFTTLLYGYGFGQYERIAPAPAFGLAAALYVLQVALSHWWLAHFRQGPLEWIWRAITYAGPKKAA